MIDLQSGQVIRTITGFGGDPRKALYLPKTNEIWVDDGDATVKAYDGTSYELIKNIPCQVMSWARMRGEYRITAFMTRQPDFSTWVTEQMD